MSYTYDDVIASRADIELTEGDCRQLEGLGEAVAYTHVLISSKLARRGFLLRGCAFAPVLP